MIVFGIGLLIATANYAFSRYILKKRPQQYAIAQIVRQWIQIIYLIILFAVGKNTPWDVRWLLVGGGLGITIPMAWFTYRLVKLNDSLGRKEEANDG